MEETVIEQASPFIMNWGKNIKPYLSKIRKHYPADLGNSITTFVDLNVGSGILLFDVLNRYKIENAYISDFNPRILLVWYLLKNHPDQFVSEVKKQEILLNNSTRLKYYMWLNAYKYGSINGCTYLNTILEGFSLVRQIEFAARFLCASLSLQKRRSCLDSWGNIYQPNTHECPKVVIDEGALFNTAGLLQSVDILDCTRIKPVKGAFVVLDVTTAPNKYSTIDTYVNRLLGQSIYCQNDRVTLRIDNYYVLMLAEGNHLSKNIQECYLHDTARLNSKSAKEFILVVRKPSN